MVLPKYLSWRSTVHITISEGLERSQRKDMFKSNHSPLKICCFSLLILSSLYIESFVLKTYFKAALKYNLFHGDRPRFYIKGQKLLKIYAPHFWNNTSQVDLHTIRNWKLKICKFYEGREGKYGYGGVCMNQSRQAKLLSSMTFSWSWECPKHRGA